MLEPMGLELRFGVMDCEIFMYLYVFKDVSTSVNDGMHLMGQHGFRSYLRCSHSLGNRCRSSHKRPGC